MFPLPAINYPNPTGKEQDHCIYVLNVMPVSSVLQQIRKVKQLEYTAGFAKSFSQKEDEIAYTNAFSKY